jgi:hypothetical protein
MWADMPDSTVDEVIEATLGAVAGEPARRVGR